MMTLIIFLLRVGSSVVDDNYDYNNGNNDNDDGNNIDNDTMSNWFGSFFWGYYFFSD